MTVFDGISLRPATRAALASLGVTEPTPIQAAALPLMLEGRDVIGQARTGSGKTLAFGLPIVETVDPRLRAVQALVLVPTRELASQVASVVQSITGERAARVALFVGGASAHSQMQALRQGAQVVVGTPGRILDQIRQRVLRLDQLRLLILDEADEMLDRGFGPDVERIIATTNRQRQTALFSATLPAWVDAMAARYLHEPVVVKVDAVAQPVESVTHAIYDVPDGLKMTALRSLLDTRGPGATLVFGRTKHGVKKLANQLAAAGYPVAALQGNLSQNARERVMAGFRGGETSILVATNVAARGLDIAHVSRVINFELPETADLLTHRVGRTGRMGREGEAITLLSPSDEPNWRKLARDLTRHPVRRPWKGAPDATGSVPSGTAVSVPPLAPRRDAGPAPRHDEGPRSVRIARPSRPVVRPPFGGPPSHGVGVRALDHRVTPVAPGPAPRRESPAPPRGGRRRGHRGGLGGGSRSVGR